MKTTHTSPKTLDATAFFNILAQTEEGLLSLDDGLDISNHEIEFPPTAEVTIAGQLRANFTEIKQWPKSITTEQSVNVSHSITGELPSGFSIGGSFFGRGATFTSYPDDFQVAGCVQNPDGTVHLTVEAAREALKNPQEDKENDIWPGVEMANRREPAPGND